MNQKKTNPEIREYVKNRIIEFKEVTFPKIVSKAKKEGGMILFGDEKGICNQENYQRVFSPVGVAPVVNLPVKKDY